MKRQRTAEALDFLVPLEARGARELEGRAGVNVAVVTSQLLGRVAPVDSRPLRSRFDGALDGEQAQSGDQD